MQQAQIRNNSKSIIEGAIPMDWNMVNLKDAAQDGSDTFVDGPFGSELKVSDYTDDGIMLIQLQNIGEGLFYSENRKYTSENKYRRLLRHSTQPGDIVIAKMSDPVARACIIPPIRDKFLVVADCVKLRPNEHEFDKRFLLYTINSDYVRKQAVGLSKGTTRLRINLTELKNLKILRPPLPEQQKIASIISKLDELIEKTDQIIEQTQRLKRGLIQKLFTEGIGHSDFKKTSIGEIPREWELTLSADLITFVTSGSRNWAKYYSETGPIMVRITNLDHDTIYSDFTNIQRVMPPAGTEGVRTRVKPNDILVSITADVGMVAVMPDLASEAFVNQHIALVRLKEGYSSKYIGRYLSWHGGGFKQFKQIQRGVTKVGLSLDDIKNVWIPLPPKIEQEKIVSIVDYVEFNLSKNKQYKKELEVLKKGLMQNLLTGKIRVRV
jgi:type I restriction enzyme, S subunit